MSEVVPWVDRDDPINGSTMEIFVDPALALKKLRRNLCIYGTPRSSWLDAALFVGVLLYAALVTLVVELFASAWSIAAVIGAAILVVSAMVGPIMSLFKADVAENIL
eukprot:Skav233291  [mRNA]  locus=scaffold1501:13613:27134:+ [translate_table: standard]